MLRKQLSSHGRSICKKLKRAVKHQSFPGSEIHLLLEAKGSIVIRVKEADDVEQFCLACVVRVVVSQEVEQIA